MHLPSMPGLLLALIAGLLLFGTKRLPEMGASLGLGIREFKKSLHEIDDAADIESPAPAEPRRLAPPTTSDAKGVTS